MKRVSHFIAICLCFCAITMLSSPMQTVAQENAGMQLMASISDTYSLSSSAKTKVSQIVKECKNQNLKSEYEIALWLHDYLTKHAQYDQSYSNYSADGVLLKGKGVCQSYTLAYQALLDAFDIPNAIIEAHSMDHAWNIVKLNGKWTHVDCTWDDPIYYDSNGQPVSQSALSGYESHEYFGLSDAQMQKDHSWDTSKYPKCYAVERNVLDVKLPSSYKLKTAVNGFDYQLKTSNGKTLTRSSITSGNTLIVVGRPTCGNTMAFIKELTIWKKVLDQNKVNVIVVFESQSQVKSAASSIPFTCAYSTDNDRALCNFLSNAKLGNYINYPLVILQDLKGKARYYSMGYVYESEKMIATAIQPLTTTVKKIALKDAKISLSKTTYTYNGKQNKPTVVVKNGSTTVPVSQYTVSYRANIKAGTGKVTITAKSNSTYLSGSITKSFIIAKAENTLTVSPASKTFTVKNCKQKAQSFTIKVAKARGSVSYTSSNKSYVTISKGKVTIKRGTPKGKYKVTVSANGDTNYKSKSKTVTITVK